MDFSLPVLVFAVRLALLQMLLELSRLRRDQSLACLREWIRKTPRISRERSYTDFHELGCLHPQPAALAGAHDLLVRAAVVVFLTAGLHYKLHCKFRRLLVHGGAITCNM